MISRAVRLLALGGACATLGCSNPTGGAAESALSDLGCTIPVQFIADGGPGKDGIPALTDPRLVAPDDPEASYLLAGDRVIGLHVGDEHLAIPVNIGWWHEVVNLNRSGLRLAVTHCPLTGSSLVFERGSASNAEFGVSGLLFMNNLMLYDRTEQPSLWPQMVRGARCGSRSGTQLPMYPSVEMTWAGWRALHPGTRVVSRLTGYSRDYTSYPYGDYARADNPALLAPMPAVDERRRPKERVLGVVFGDGKGVALPFGALDAVGPVAAISLSSGGESAVVFWDRATQGAAAFVPRFETQALTFRVVGSSVVDEQTGSSWSVDGLAIAGPLKRAQLVAVNDAFVSYWFAWAAFYPGSVLWSAP